MRGFEEALTDHIQGLRRYARIYAKSADEADDLVQETLVRVLERVSVWNPDQIRNLKAYLFRTLRNVFLDRVGKDAKLVNGDAFTQVEHLLAGPPIEHLRLQLHDVAEALYGLTPEHREILVLVGIEGMTYEEAAKVLEVPAGTVMSRLSRARESLRRSLAEPKTGDDTAAPRREDAEAPATVRLDASEKRAQGGR